MSRAQNAKNVDKLQVALDYLTEYSGVRGAAIADNEGLVITKSGLEDFNADLFAATSLVLNSVMDRELVKITDSQLEFVSIKTAQDWITVARSGRFTLIVAAERRTDDLLGVRISRALEMITAHLKAKYPVLSQSFSTDGKARIMEEIHV
jgi:predicted regulator of Ras-like GTPase activity (Roadblock/LC7/MglB family)